MIHDSERIALSSISLLFLTVFVAMAGFFFGLSIGIFIPITVLVLIVAYALLFDRRFLYTGLLCLCLLYTSLLKYLFISLKIQFTSSNISVRRLKTKRGFSILFVTDANVDILHQIGHSCFVLFRRP